MEHSVDIVATDPRELLRKLKEQLKIGDSDLLRAHILRLAKAWGLKVRLPAKAKTG